MPKTSKRRKRGSFDIEYILGKSASEITAEERARFNAAVAEFNGRLDRYIDGLTDAVMEHFGKRKATKRAAKGTRGKSTKTARKPARAKRK